MTNRSRPLRLLNKFVSGLTSFAMIVTSIPVAHAQQIVIDPSTPGVRLHTLGNGMPRLDIATPVSGVSVNKFLDFNVGAQGLVVNNAQNWGNNSWSGQPVDRNENLVESGPADVIVNEVTGSGVSTLTGRTEIVGQRANLIIANPNGIDCDGCRFVRSVGTTLTTGVPVVDGGDVELQVREGVINIGPGGFRAFNDSNLVGRHVVLNGPAFTTGREYEGRTNETLTISGGAQNFDPVTATTVGAASAAPQTRVYAVDATEFGAMLSGAITVLGTEAGLGVNVMGAIDGAWQVQLSAEGDLFYGDVKANELDVSSVGGEVRQYGDATVTGAASISGEKVTVYADRSLEAGGDVTVDADGDVVIVGAVSGVNVFVSSQSGRILNSGFVTADGELDLYAEQEVVNQRKVATEYDTDAEPALGAYLDAYLNDLAEGGAAADIAAEMLTRAAAQEVVGEYVLQGAALTGGDVFAYSVSSDILNLGGAIAAAGDVTLDAGRDVINEYVATRHRLGAEDGCSGEDCGYRIEYHPGEILAGGAVSLFAVEDVEIRGSDVAAAESVVIGAGQDAVVSLINNAHSFGQTEEYIGPGLTRQVSWCEKGNCYYTTSVGTVAQSQDATGVEVTLAPSAILSLFGDVTIDAGRDAIVMGSELSALGEIDIAAAERVVLSSYSAANEHYVRRPYVYTTSYEQWVDKGETRTVTTYHTGEELIAETDLVTAGADISAGGLTVNAGTSAMLAGVRAFVDGDVVVDALDGAVLIDSAEIPALIEEEDEVAVSLREARDLGEAVTDSALRDLVVEYLIANPKLTAVAALSRAEGGAAVAEAAKKVGLQGGQSLFGSDLAEQLRVRIGQDILAAAADNTAALGALDDAAAVQIAASNARLAELTDLLSLTDTQRATLHAEKTATIEQTRTDSRAAAEATYAARMAEIDAEYAGTLTYTTQTWYCCQGKGEYGWWVTTTHTNHTQVALKQADEAEAQAIRDAALNEAEGTYAVDMAQAVSDFAESGTEAGVNGLIAAEGAALESYLAGYRDDRTAQEAAHLAALDPLMARSAALQEAQAELDGATMLALARGTAEEGAATLADALTAASFGDLTDIQTLTTDAGVLRNTRTHQVEREVVGTETRSVGYYEDQTFIEQQEVQEQQQYTYQCGKDQWDTCTGTHWVTVTRDVEVLRPVWIETGTEEVEVVSTETETVTTTAGLFGETLEEQDALLDAVAFRFRADPALDVLTATSRAVLSAQGGVNVAASEAVYLLGATTVRAEGNIAVAAGDDIGVLGVADSQFRFTEVTDAAFHEIADALGERVLLRDAREESVQIGARRYAATLGSVQVPKQVEQQVSYACGKDDMGTCYRTEWVTVYEAQSASSLTAEAVTADGAVTATVQELAAQIGLALSEAGETPEVLTTTTVGDLPLNDTLSAVLVAAAAGLSLSPEMRDRLVANVAAGARIAPRQVADLAVSDGADPEGVLARLSVEATTRALLALSEEIQVEKANGLSSAAADALTERFAVALQLKTDRAVAAGFNALAGEADLTLTDIKFGEATSEYRVANATLSAGGDLTLFAVNDILNVGGSVGATGLIDIAAVYGDVRSDAIRFAPDEASINGCGTGDCSVTPLNAIDTAWAGADALYAGEVVAGANLSVDAGGSLTSLGGSFLAGGDLSLAARRDVTLSTVLQSDTFRNGTLELATYLLQDGDLIMDGRVGVSTSTLQSWGVTYYALNEGGVLSAGGDLTITNTEPEAELDETLVDGVVSLSGIAGQVGGDLVIVSDGDLSLTAAKDVESFRQSGGGSTLSLYRETPIGVSFDVAGDAELFGALVALEGADIDVAGNLTVSAHEQLMIAAAPEFAAESYSFSRKSFFKSRRKSLDIQNNTHLSAALAAGGDLRLVANDDILVAGSSLTAGNDVYVSAGNNAFITAVLDQYDTTYKSSSGYLGGFLFARSLDHTLNQTVARGSVLAALHDIDVIGERGSVELQASDFTAGNAITISAGLGEDADPNAHIRLRAAVERVYESLQSYSDNGLRWKSISAGSDTGTLVQNTFDAPELFFQSSNGMLVDIEGVQPGMTPEEQLDLTLQKITNGKSYADIVAGLQDGTITPEEIETWHTEWEEIQTGVSPVAQLVIAAALTIATGPAAMTALGFEAATIGSVITGNAAVLAAGGTVTALESAAAAALTAGINSFASSIITGAVGGNLDLAQAFKGAGISALTAGLGSYVNFGDLVGIPEGDSIIPGISGEGTAQFSAQALFDGAADAAMSAGILAAAGEGDFGDLLMRNLASYGLSRAMAAAQFGVGELGDGDDGLAEGHPIKIGLHAMIGCAFAEASGGDCAAGAAAGAMAEIASIGFAAADWQTTGQSSVAVAFSQLLGGLAAEIVAGQGAIGSQVAGSATSNNYLNHTQRAQAVEKLTYIQDCQAGRVVCTDEQLAGALEDYNELKLISVNQDLRAMEVCGSGNELECQKEVSLALEYYAWKDSVNSDFLTAGVFADEDLKLTNILIRTYMKEPWFSPTDPNVVLTPIEVDGRNYWEFADTLCGSGASPECSRVFLAEHMKDVEQTQENILLALEIASLAAGGAGLVVKGARLISVLSKVERSADLAICAFEPDPFCMVTGVGPGVKVQRTGNRSWGNGTASSREEFDHRYGDRFDDDADAAEGYAQYQFAAQTDKELVLGRLWDTEAGEELGMARLNSPRWSINVNDAFIRGGIDAKKAFYIGSPAEIRNYRGKWDPVAGGRGDHPTTVFYREMVQLRDAGYRLDGHYMRPPD